MSKPLDLFALSTLKVFRQFAFKGNVGSVSLDGKPQARRIRKWILIGLPPQYTFVLFSTAFGIYIYRDTSLVYCKHVIQLLLVEETIEMTQKR